jgi:uncharacterized protein YcfL
MRAALAIVVGLALTACSEIEPLLMSPTQGADANSSCSVIQAELDANDKTLANASGKEAAALQARRQTLTSLEFQRCAPLPSFAKATQ